MKSIKPLSWFEVLKFRLFGKRTVGVDMAVGKDFTCRTTGYVYKGRFCVTGIKFYVDGKWRKSLTSKKVSAG